MRNQDGFLDYTADQSLSSALGQVKVGDKIKLEMEVLVKGNDEKGLSFDVVPGSVVPEGFEREDDPDKVINVAAPQPPGSLQTAPVDQVMNLKRKGD